MLTPVTQLPLSPLSPQVAATWPCDNDDNDLRHRALCVLRQVAGSPGPSTDELLSHIRLTGHGSSIIPDWSHVDITLPGCFNLTSRVILICAHTKPSSSSWFPSFMPIVSTYSLSERLNISISFLFDEHLSLVHPPAINWSMLLWKYSAIQSTPGPRQV